MRPCPHRQYSALRPACVSPSLPSALAALEALAGGKPQQGYAVTFRASSPSMDAARVRAHTQAGGARQAASCRVLRGVTANVGGCRVAHNA